MKFQPCQILLFNWPQKHTHTHDTAPDIEEHAARSKCVCGHRANVCFCVCVCVCVMESQRDMGIEVTEANREEEKL